MFVALGNSIQNQTENKILEVNSSADGLTDSCTGIKFLPRRDKREAPCFKTI